MMRVEFVRNNLLIINKKQDLPITDGSCHSAFVNPERRFTTL